MRRRHAFAFTLVEVLVALAIVALGTAAVTSALRSGIDTTSRLRDRLFAQWVAENRLVEVRLADAAPNLGRTSGEIEWAAQRWRWTQTVSTTPIEGLLRIDIDVASAAAPSASALASLSGFRGDVFGDRGRSDAVWDVAPPADR